MWLPMNRLSLCLDGSVDSFCNCIAEGRQNRTPVTSGERSKSLSGVSLSSSQDCSSDESSKDDARSKFYHI